MVTCFNDVTLSWSHLWTDFPRLLKNSVMRLPPQLFLLATLPGPLYYLNLLYSSLEPYCGNLSWFPSAGFLFSSSLESGHCRTFSFADFDGIICSVDGQPQQFFFEDLNPFAEIPTCSAVMWVGNDS